MPIVIPGPVVFTAASQTYTEVAHVRAFLWEGATSAGDTCEVHELGGTQRLLFAGRAVGSQTWQGVVIECTAPTGLECTSLAAGRIIVYLAEPDGV